MKHFFFSALALSLMLGVRASSDRGVTGTPVKPKSGVPSSSSQLLGPASQNVVLTDADNDGYYAEIDDCDDADPLVNPGATEVCNGVDDNCIGGIDDGLAFWQYEDSDGDSYGNPWASIYDCYIYVGYVSDNTDCDDSDASINPSASELCNGVDDNCIGGIDEGLAFWQYEDSDGDSYGNPWVSIYDCYIYVGYVSDNTDCNDSDPSVNPGASEVCNSADDNCNWIPDDGLPLYTYYFDWDGDGYGGSFWWWTFSDCYGTPPPWYSMTNDDCDDYISSINPGASEACNEEDDDCDGLTDEGFPPGAWYYSDIDGDGYGHYDFGEAYFCGTAPSGWALASLGTDCDEFDSSVNPGAAEVFCNGIDDNCNGLFDDDNFTQYLDGDNDGYGNPAVFVTGCPLLMGYVLNNEDCDDTDPSGTVASTLYIDMDYDGYGQSASVTSCPGGACAGNYNVSISIPAYADETTWAVYNAYGALVVGGGPYFYDETINFSFSGAMGPYTFVVSTVGFYCDNYGTVSVTAEGGYSASLSFGPCSVDSLFICTGYNVATLNGDCADSDAAINPGATEICNGPDDDCDGLADDADPTLSGAPTWYADADDDNFGNPSVSTMACTTPIGYVANNTDCDDSNDNNYPGATEVWDCADNDCDGLVDEGTGALPLTQLNPASCGVSVLNFSHVLRANAMAGAVQYEFEFFDGTNTYYELRPNRGFYFSLWTWPQFSTTYQVRVRWFDGTDWSCWGPVCTVTTPAMPVTQLQAGDCGVTVSSFSHVLRAISMSGATQYEFEFDDGVNTYYELRPNRAFYFSLWSWPQFSTTYTVKVRWYDGTTWSPWGPPCTVTTPPMPTTQLQAGDCGAIVYSWSQVLRAVEMPGASQYEFRLSDGTNTWDLLRPNRGMYIKLYGYPSGYFPAGSYTMQVRWKTPTSPWSAWGPPCSLTFASPLVEGAEGMEAVGLDVQAFPVPFDNVVNLSVESYNADLVHISVLDVNGRIVEDRQVSMEHTGLLTLGESWSSGVYMIRVQQGAEVRTLRVVKTSN